ncbi:MAG: glutamate ligase domain-containing protein [Prevotellamassilia sp.]
MRFDVSPEQAAQAIAAYVPSNNRSELLRTAHNELIVDAYNANPTSMRAALDNFALISHPHKMLILGEMRELGAVSAEEHQKVAAQALSLGAEAVWFVGRISAIVKVLVVSDVKPPRQPCRVEQTRRTAHLDKGV